MKKVEHVNLLYYYCSKMNGEQCDLKSIQQKWERFADFSALSVANMYLQINLGWCWTGSAEGR